ncbi:MAG: cytochrome C oxidase subunit IV family protein [Acidobacteria bacterium]|nr:cytochrome C oxidase subunit IV family protein [Acidobacteriota bacterium]MBI3656123.1 cytochrome C oxidase subunit IV family protein [Acidobacteriota bacterium]
MEIAHPHGYRVYGLCWLGLLGLTVLAMGVSHLSMAPAIKALVLVGLSLVKVLLIAAYFMHLRFEKLNLVLITGVPLLLAVIMWFMIVPDTRDTSRRVLVMRDTAVQAPAAPHAQPKP